MIESGEKIKELALIAVQEIGITSLSKELLRSIYEFLDIEDTKSPPKSAIAEKISYIYELSRGQYDIYLNHPKSKQVYAETKELVWKIFKNIQQRINQRKYMQPKPMMRDHMQHLIPPINQNMNMNMVNMFMDVPNLQTVEEIEIFQRKMFEIYKNFMPQVLSTMPTSNQGNYFRNQNYQQSFMGGMGGMGNMQGMQNMTGGMQGMQNMAGMTGMGGMSMNSNRNGMGMMPNMGYNQKFNDFYETNAYLNRYQHESKIINHFQSQQSRQSSQKNKMEFNRSASSQGNIPNTGFSFYGERNQNDEFRGAFKNPYQQNKIITSSQELQRKPVYSQKYIGNEESRESMFMQSNFYDFSPTLEKLSSKEFQKEREPQISSTPELPMGSEPRKMVKKDLFCANINQQLEKGDKNPKVDSEDNEKDNFLFYNRIVEMDPFNEVQEVLQLKYITQEKTQVSYEVPLKIMKKLYQNSDRFDIEIRCIKLDKNAENQIAWPQRYRLSVDEQVVEKFSNLQSSFKKRKENSFLFVKHFGLEKSADESSNILMEIRNTQKGPNFLLGILLVVKHSIKQMYEKILKNIDEDNISEYFKTSSEKKQQLPLTQISISPFSKTSGKLIKDPVRGNNCTHPECFDLQEFLTHLHVSQIRQWKCPLCQKQSKKFVIDIEIKNVLADIPRMLQQPKQIVFYPNGGHYLKFSDNLPAETDKKCENLQKQSCKESQFAQLGSAQEKGQKPQPK